MGRMKERKMYLTKRPENGVWYFRRPIPKELQPFVVSGNKQTITVSLKSKSLAEARKHHHAHWMESERVLDEARARKDAGASAVRNDFKLTHGKKPTSRELVTKRGFGEFTKAELMAIVQRWYSQTQEKNLERCRFTFNFGDSESKKHALADLDTQLFSLERRDSAEPDFEVFRMIREMVESAGGYVSITKDGGEIDLHLWFVAVVRERLIQLNRFSRGILETGVPPLFVDASPEFAIAQSGASLGGKPSASLDDLILRFDKDPSHEHLKQKTRDEFKLVYAMLREFVGGATPCQSITREHITELRDVYQNIPAHSASLYPKKKMREVAELAKRDGKLPMERSTFNKRMTLLASLFNFAVRENMIAASPALKLKMKKGRKSAGEKSFTVDQLKTIFEGPLYKKFAGDELARFTPNHRLCPHEFWAPLIALFQGCRMEELLQLRLDDIAKKDAVDCIHIRAGEGQSVKTDASLRTIPLHPELKKLGFLCYVKEVGKAGLDELFPDAKRGKTYGNRSHNYSKRFNRYLSDIGLKTGRNQVFHSFRHTFVDALRNAGVPEDIRRRLGGWTDKTSLESEYGGRLLPLLSRELDKLHFDGLDFSSLHVADK